ncbi:MAG: citryl-CoA lyase [Pirellulales bacterium]|nr:citryl-CoA lyase [Pirellulales bacterium]
MSEFWRTQISHVESDEILVRGYPVDQLTERCSFGEVVYLLLTGELPSGKQGKLMEAILVACCDHGLASPSVDAVRFVASSGVPLQSAVAAGVSAIGEWHGGAIEPCAQMLYQAVSQQRSATELFTKMRSAGKRLPGFGHRTHTRDPRAVVLLKLADAWGLRGPHTAFAGELEESSEHVLGRRLNMNVDGAIAALMCDMDIDPALGKAFFIIGRAPGYVAHAHEQTTRERPFKAPDPSEITYTGPPKRTVPERRVSPDND